jgi:multidrug transporter EmrE-like cation transporter
MTSLTLLIACILSSATASIFLKVGASESGNIKNIFALVNNPMLLLGAAFYAISFVCYVYVLKQLPLSLAQPVITVGVSAIAAIVAVFFFREPMEIINWLGFILVCVGICFLFAGRA